MVASRTDTYLNFTQIFGVTSLFIFFQQGRVTKGVRGKFRQR